MVAYDRTLLASAKSIGELLEVEGEGADARFAPTRLYSRWRPSRPTPRSRMFHRVSTAAARLVEGHEELGPGTAAPCPTRAPYAALVDFYDDHSPRRSARVAVLLQPVGENGRGVARSRWPRRWSCATLARQILLDTAWRELLLAAVVALVVVLAVQRHAAGARAQRPGARPARRRPDADRGGRCRASCCPGGRHQPGDGAAAESTLTITASASCAMLTPAAHAAGGAQDPGRRRRCAPTWRRSRR